MKNKSRLARHFKLQFWFKKNKLQYHNKEAFIAFRHEIFEWYRIYTKLVYKQIEPKQFRREVENMTWDLFSF